MHHMARRTSVLSIAVALLTALVAGWTPAVMTSAAAAARQQPLGEGVQLTEMASMDVSPMPVGCCRVALDRISLVPGSTLNASIEPWAEPHLLVIDAGVITTADGRGATYGAGTAFTAPANAAYDFRNDTQECVTLLRVRLGPHQAGGSASSYVSGPALPTAPCGESGQVMTWHSSPPLEPARLVLARLRLQIDTGSGIEGASTGPVAPSGSLGLVIEDGILVIDPPWATMAAVDPGAESHIPTTGVAILAPGRYHALATQSSDPTSVLVFGMVSAGQPVFTPYQTVVGRTDSSGLLEPVIGLACVGHGSVRPTSPTCLTSPMRSGRSWLPICPRPAAHPRAARSLTMPCVGWSKRHMLSTNFWSPEDPALARE